MLGRLFAPYAVATASSPRVYRPRRPERTVLYRSLALHFEHFVQVYEERFLHTHGYLRGYVEPAVHRYLDCGIFDQGVARVRCKETSPRHRTAGTTTSSPDVFG